MTEDLSQAEIDGLFDSIAKVAKGVAKGVGGAVKAVDKVYVAATPSWVRHGVGMVTGGTQAKLAWDTAKGIAAGQRIDRALIGAAKNQVDAFKGAAPFLQLGLQFVPGVGQGISSAIGAGVALADGKPITEAALAAVKAAMPGGPIAQRAMDVGLRMASAAAAGKRLDVAALEAARAQIPGGKLAQAAFDTGLALAQGKKLQEAGMRGAAGLVPNHPLAQGAFEMTKRMLAGQRPEGSTAAAMRRAMPASPPRGAMPSADITRGGAAPIVVRRAMGGGEGGFPPSLGPLLGPLLGPFVTPAPPPAPPVVPPKKSNVLPYALGGVALAAVAGGAWWWSTQPKRRHS